MIWLVILPCLPCLPPSRVQTHHFVFCVLNLSHFPQYKSRCIGGWYQERTVACINIDVLVCSGLTVLIRSGYVIEKMVKEKDIIVKSKVNRYAWNNEFFIFDLAIRGFS